MRVFLISMLLFSLLSCAPRRPAKVDEIGTQSNQHSHSSEQLKSRLIINDSNKTTHTVVKGDSLYSIGFRYQKDYKTLAAINNINPPYRIYPNQIIKLTGPAKKIVFKPANSNNGIVQTKPIISNQPLTARTEPLNNNKAVTQTTAQTKPASQSRSKPINTPTVKKPSANNVVIKQPQVTPPKAEQSKTNKPLTKKPVVITAPNNTNLKWLWPTNGKIRTTFLASNPARKGISIGGKEGQAVKAAEAGVVVYSGNGLLGYGELIIIKHNKSYLSAYGHNKSLKVKEGQTVNRGEVIAELGSTGTNINNLHFEIRKNGKPVNPLKYVKP